MNGHTTDAETLTWQEFYDKLGYLYYGIAAAEGNLTADQSELLRKNTNKIWQKYGSTLEGFQGYTPNKVEALYDWLGLNETGWDYCVNEFTWFVSRHQQDMPVHMQDFALQSAAELAQNWGAEENKALIQLRRILKK